MADETPLFGANHLVYVYVYRLGEIRWDQEEGVRTLACRKMNRISKVCQCRNEIGFNGDLGDLIVSPWKRWSLRDKRANLLLFCWFCSRMAISFPASLLYVTAQMLTKNCALKLSHSKQRISLLYASPFGPLGYSLERLIGKGRVLLPGVIKSLRRSYITTSNLMQIGRKTHDSSSFLMIVLWHHVIMRSGELKQWSATGKK